ncbi:MAG: LemA family protein [Nanoarchaeota archaeon]|nr:LemA family protein [Nanoarchaeota archaeon]
MIWLWIVGIIVILSGVVLIIYYNKFIVLGNRIDNSLAQIDVQLKKRADLVPNLVDTVKAYAKHEKSIIAEVTKARKEMLSAKSLPDKVKAGDQLQNSLKSIFALAENYPDLKANQNFLHLQQELSAIEDKVAYARQFYNDSILSYNNSTKVFPGVMFAKLYRVKARQFLEITTAERKVVKVNF